MQPFSYYSLLSSCLHFMGRHHINSLVNIFNSSSLLPTKPQIWVDPLGLDHGKKVAEVSRITVQKWSAVYLKPHAGSGQCL